MSLISHYPLNGNANDVLKRYHGTPSGVAFVNGPAGECAQFDGVNDIVSFGLGNDLFPLYNFSCSIWFRCFGTTATTGTTPSIFGLTYGVRLRIISDYLQFGLDNGTTFIYLNSPSTYDFYNDNIWHHVAVAASATEMFLYIDGDLVASRSTTWPGETRWPTNSVNIGRDNNNVNYYFRGLLDDFKIYDHVLSEKEVKELSQGLVTHVTFNDGSVSEATGNSTDLVTNSLLFNNTPKVGEYSYTGDGANRSLVITDSPSLIENQTIVMWLYPESFGNRMNPWNKNYGGEGTITQELDAGLTYYWGTNGGNSSPYQGFGTSAGALTLNQWNHIAIVRDLDNLTLTWYINGIQDNTVAAAYSASAVSVSNLTIGDGYTTPYNGRIDDVRQYATALSATDIDAIYRNGLAVDNSAKMHSNYLCESGIVNPNILDYKTWVVGTNGSQPGFSSNGASAENEIILDTDPFGKTVPVWSTIGEPNSDSDGGWNGSLNTCDSSKMYRFSVWIRRTVIGNGSTYLGLNESGGVVLNRTNGAVTTNPYFWAGGWGYPANEWVLIVGHLWPAGSGTGADHEDSGLYRLDGTKDPINRDFVFDPAITSILHRSYLYYSTDVSTVQQFVYPRIDLVDGTEPSINALLSGFDSINSDRISELGASDIPDTLSVEYAKTKTGQFSEVGITDYMSSFLPLDGKYTDVALGSTIDQANTGHSSGFLNVAGYTGINFSGAANDDVRYTLTNGFNESEDWSISFFIYPRSFTGLNSYPIFITFMWSPYIAVDAAGENLRVSVRDSTVSQLSYTSSASLNLNEWAMVTVTHNKSTATITIYKNGVSVGTFATTALYDNTKTAFNIGNYDSANYYTDGVMRNIKIFPRTITPEEVAQEYNSTIKALINNSTAFSSEFIEK